jgi:hypothetical protein
VLSLRARGNRIVFRQSLRGLVTVRALLFAALCLAPAYAATIYKWVDEQGVTHISDKVPERYKASAKQIDSRGYNVSEADRRAAAAQAERTMQAAAPPTQATSAALEVNAERKPPIQAARTGGDCASLWRAFYDAQACFDKGPKASGLVNPTRNPECPVVLAPSQRCGPAVLSPQDRAADRPVFPSGDEPRWSTR